MKSVVFFNNKGGVGKTTLLCNIAGHFATELGRRVLVIDCDPQCNATQLILSAKKCDELYTAKHSKQDTLRTVLDPLQEGESAINVEVTPMPATGNRFGVDILPGHPKLSLLEDRLGEAWTESSGGQIGGLRKTNWCTLLLRHFRTAYDVVFIDVGPSLGSLNRSVLLGAQFFVTPMGCDIFSIVGIRNIAQWLRQWLRTYEKGVERALEEERELVAKYQLRKDPEVSKGFAGYTVQQYITKSKGGTRRATVAFEKILTKIPEEIEDNLGKFALATSVNYSMKLGDVPNMFSLVPLAQSANAPIAGLTSGDGLVGSQYHQAEEYAHLIRKVANRLAQNIEVEASNG